jgi:tetratricopeptide (TPR) repeat protein
VPDPEKPSPVAAAGMPSSIRRSGPLALVCTCAALAYANTLANGFVWDDEFLVKANPWIEGPSHLREIFTTHFWGFAAQSNLSHNYYRPLVHVTLMLCRAVFGMRPWGYHLVLVLGHVAASALVYSVGRALFARRQEGSLAALAAGLLFAVHPIHVEAVAWVAALNDVALTLFVLLALRLMMTAAPGLSVRAVLGGGLFLIALLFKEPAVMAVGMLAIFDLLGEGRSWSLRQWLGRYAPLGAALAVYWGLRHHALAGVGRTLHHTGLGTWGYVLNAPPLLAQMVSGLVLPLRLNAYHVFEPADSPWSPLVLAGVIVFAGLAALAVALWRSARPALIPLFWCLLPLLPALYIPTLGKNTFAERYLYLPSVGFVLLAGLGLAALERRGLASPRAVRIALAVLVVAGGLATFRHNTVWHDNLSLWLDVQDQSPEDPEIEQELGLALMNAGRPAEAIPHLEHAEVSANSLRNLGLAYGMAGRLEDAAGALGASVQRDPQSATGWSNLCLVHKKLKQLDRAIEECERALQLDDRLANVQASLGQMMMQTGRYDEAARHLEAALALDPKLVGARRLLEQLDRERQRSASPPPALTP